MSASPEKRNMSPAGRKSVSPGRKSIPGSGRRSSGDRKSGRSTRGTGGTHSDWDASSSSDDEDESERLEDQLTDSKLKKLQEIFELADEDGGGGLDIDEFRIAMHKALGNHLTKDELDKMFMKVDTNCDGTVDWDEYLSYMLLEYREKDAMNFLRQPKPFPSVPVLVPNMSKYQRHHDSIMKLFHMPSISKYHTGLYKVAPDKSLGRIITVTKTGLINVWNQDLKHIRSHTVEHINPALKQISVWVTDAVFMPNLNMMAVSLTAGYITFYDLTANHLTPVLTFTDLEICVTAMDYYSNEQDPSKAVLLWGDARGHISGLKIEGCPSICFFNPSTTKNFRPAIPFKELIGNVGKFCGVRGYKLNNIHDDFVLKIRYLPSYEYFLSCCRSSTSSLYMGDIEGKRKSVFKVAKGVYDFDYSRKNNTIVTGGKDCIVRAWNPYVTTKPVMLLQGHKTPVIFVVINEVHEHVITISEGKEIQIYDLNTQTCVQNIYKKWIPLGPRPISSMCFNPHRQALYLATNQLAKFEHKAADAHGEVLVSHESRVNVVLYNSLFDLVVSGSADSQVIVWHTHSGDKIIQFYAYRSRSLVGEVSYVEITKMRFDPTLRRLITASRDGKVRLWNFNNGAFLRELESFDNLEVTGIICPTQRILTAGWSQVIRVYIDSRDDPDETVVQWSRQHTDDISALAFNPPSTVVTGAHDGFILVWSLETGRVTVRLNANIGQKPITCNTESRMQLQKQQAKKVISRTALNQKYQVPVPPIKKPPVESEQNSDDEDEAADEEVEDKAKAPREAHNEKFLKTWLAYNTRRESICATIPLSNRRESVLLPFDVAQTLHFRRRGKGTGDALQIETSKEAEAEAEAEAANQAPNKRTKKKKVAIKVVDYLQEENEENANQSNSTKELQNNRTDVNKEADKSKANSNKARKNNDTVMDNSERNSKGSTDDQNNNTAKLKQVNKDGSTGTGSGERKPCSNKKLDPGKNSNTNQERDEKKHSKQKPKTAMDNNDCPDSGLNNSTRQREKKRDSEAKSQTSAASDNNLNNNSNQDETENSNNNATVKEVHFDVDSDFTDLHKGLNEQGDEEEEEGSEEEEEDSEEEEEEAECSCGPPHYGNINNCSRHGSVIDQDTQFRKLCGGKNWTRRSSMSTEERYYEAKRASQVPETKKETKVDHRVYKGKSDEKPPPPVKTDQEKYDTYLLQNEATVDRILILEARVQHALTATIAVTNACGWIRFWSIDHEGGLLGQFNAGQKVDDVVGAMATDENNQILVTGDCDGYLKVWDISEYCVNPDSLPKATDEFIAAVNEERAKYPFLWQTVKVRQKSSSQGKFRPPHSVTYPEKTWHAPFLLNCFQGHILGVTDVALLDGGKEFVSGSLDHSVRLWTIYGEFIGVYGNDMPWKRSGMAEVSSHRNATKRRKLPQRKLPSDIRRVASSSTLKVLNGGKVQHWSLAKNIVMVWVPMMLASRQRVKEQQQREKESKATYRAVAAFKGKIKPKEIKKPIRAPAKRGADKSPDKSESGETNLGASSKEESPPARRITRRTPKMASFVRMAQTKEEEDREKFEKEEKGYITMEFNTKSTLLGKYYKAHGKHQQLPPPPQVRFFSTQCDAYCSLPCYDLDPVSEKDKTGPIAIVQDIYERNCSRAGVRKTFNQIVKRSAAVKIMKPKEKKGKRSPRRGKFLKNRQMKSPTRERILPAIGEKSS